VTVSGLQSLEDFEALLEAAQRSGLALLDRLRTKDGSAKALAFLLNLLLEVGNKVIEGGGHRAISSAGQPIARTHGSCEDHPHAHVGTGVGSCSHAA
jgi:hypothetical protein